MSLVYKDIQDILYKNGHTKFHQNPVYNFRVIVFTNEHNDWQTDKQTDAAKNSTPVA